eukprot:6622407-Pyramimonas_sp.AAC.1
MECSVSLLLIGCGARGRAGEGYRRAAGGFYRRERHAGVLLHPSQPAHRGDARRAPRRVTRANQMKQYIPMMDQPWRCEAGAAPREPIRCRKQYYSDDGPIRRLRHHKLRQHKLVGPSGSVAC